MVFEKLFTKLGIPVTVLFDVDDEIKHKHKTLNDAIRKLSAECNLVEFDPNVEEGNGYPISKKNDALAFIDHLGSLTSLKAI